MRRRTRAALLLCGPLVAGCGTATRIDFARHTRPASPFDVSVWSGPRAMRLDPSRVRPGPVLFNVSNQSGRAERFSVRVRGGRVVAQTPAIAAGQTAQFKATLRGSPGIVSAVGASPNLAATKLARLSVSGRPRTGDDELTQP